MQFPNISPIAFSILGLEIRWYALAYIFGFILAELYIKQILKKSTNNPISYKQLDSITTYIIVGVILGGRFGYILFYNFEYYSSNLLSIFKLWEGGMSFHGGLIGAVSSFYIWCKIYKKPFLYIADIISMVAPIGLFLGRVANFINAELYGRKTSSVFGIIFPGTDGIPRHPSQLYEAFMEGILLFIILKILRSFKQIRNRYGITLFSFLGLYGIFRIIAELFREPDPQLGYLWNGITMGQILSLPMVILSITSIIYLYYKSPVIDIYVSSPLLESFNVITRFFTRNGGISEGVFKSSNAKFETSDKKENVEMNRKLMLQTINCDAKTNLITLNQQHTNKIITILEPINDTSKFLNIEADGIITNQKKLAIGVITADCIPVLLFDTKLQLLCILHCGWKGIYNNIIHEAILKFKSIGSNIKNLLVALGPSLKQKSYEVDTDFYKNIISQDLKYTKLFKPVKNKYLFDCTLYCLMKLKQEGIKNSKIDIIDLDTYTNEDLFFSYRRSLITKDHLNIPTNEGRQLSIIMKI